MLILLDEQLPRRLARRLRSHQVRTVQQQGWQSLGNGELLRRAGAAGFQALVTADQNMQFQQNFAELPLGVIVLLAPSNVFEDLVPLVPDLLEAIRLVQPGEVRRVGVP